MKKISHVYALICDDPENGEEGIVSFAGMAMVAGHKRTLHIFRKVAKEAIEKCGAKNVRIVQFNSPEELEKLSFYE